MKTTSPCLRKPFLVLLVLLLISAYSDTSHPSPLKIMATMIRYTKASSRIPVGATGFVDASMPQVSGWNVTAIGGSKAEIFAMCATKNLRAAPSTSVPFTIEQCFGCYGAGKAKCGTDQLLTGGGFSLTDGNNRFLADGAASDFSSWSVLAAGDGYASTTPHPSAWATCVLLSQSPAAHDFIYLGFFPSQESHGLLEPGCLLHLLPSRESTSP